MNNPALFNTWKWQPDMRNLLRFPFEKAGQIDQNHSQAWQDLFVLSMLDGLSNGSYLEVGANVASFHNNTWLLERVFGWTGISIEYDPACFQSWLQERPQANFILADALALDYHQAIPRWFGEDCRRIDYLQLDIDPSFNTLQVLKRLPLDTHRFSVITFETDAYSRDYRARDESRQILAGHGYQLVARDLCVMYEVVSPDPIPFEDWWVDPQVVSADKIKTLQSLPQQPLLPQHLIFQSD